MRVRKTVCPAVLAALCLVGSGSLTTAVPAWGLEAKMYAVTVWNAGCGGSTRNWWDNMADAWYDEITNSGWSFFGFCMAGHCGDAYSRDGRQVNGNIVNSQYADTSVVAWGNDTSHMDEGDAVLIAWHGAESGNVYLGSMRVNEAGGGNCTLRRDELQIGDSNSIEAFLEKPQTSAGLINGGFFAFNRRVFDYLFDDRPCALEHEPMSALTDTGELRAHVHHGFWQCMDTVRELDILQALWHGDDAPWAVWR